MTPRVGQGGWVGCQRLKDDSGNEDRLLLLQSHPSSPPTKEVKVTPRLDLPNQRGIRQDVDEWEVTKE